MFKLSTTALSESPSQAALKLVQSEFQTYHPLVALARLAHRAEVTSDPRLELEVHRTILPYVTPKLSSIEVLPENDSRRRVIISLFDEELVEDAVPGPVHVQAPLLALEEEVVPLDAE